MSIAMLDRPLPAAKAIIFLAGIVCFTFSAPAYADDVYTICIGEYKDRCEAQSDVYFYCGTSPQQAGAALCTVPTTTGKTVSNFTLLPLDVRDGNKCGYARYRITCKR